MNETTKTAVAAAVVTVAAVYAVRGLYVTGKHFVQEARAKKAALESA